jgi:transglutaminase-like putative cysteine protease
LCALALLAAPSRGAAASDLYLLGYRPYDPISPNFWPQEATKDQRRYRIKVSAVFLVHRNPRNENVVIHLPLPPDNLYQKVYTATIAPAPTQILQSRYGQRIAVFDFGQVPTGAGVEVSYAAEATIGLVDAPVDPTQVGTLEQIPPQIKQDYLVDGPFYHIRDPYITRAAEQALQGERNPYRMIARIFAYTHERLRYLLDNKKVDAIETLRNGEGSCSEHSFVMIALARASGLPARYISGSSVNAAKADRNLYDRINHKIIEVFLPLVGWVPVESTGNRRRALAEPERFIGRSTHRMLFFATEPEPGLAPLDPRANIFTIEPFGVGSEIKLQQRVMTHWERVD